MVFWVVEPRPFVFDVGSLKLGALVCWGCIRCIVRVDAVGAYLDLVSARRAIPLLAIASCGFGGVERYCLGVMILCLDIELASIFCQWFFWGGRRWLWWLMPPLEVDG